jgi:hypothetical protein
MLIFIMLCVLMVNVGMVSATLLNVVAPDWLQESHAGILKLFTTIIG